MMKKIVVSLCAICVVLSFSSCRSAKEITTVSSLNGEWNIIEINGSAVTPGSGKDFPYIEFDTTTGKLSGNSGCNRMMGSFDTNAKAGEIDLGAIAGTRMMCPDMTIEQNVLNALKNVKGYKKAGSKKMALVNSNKRPVIVLEPRKTVAPITALEGEWKITDVKGEAIPTDLEKQPFISFDLKTGRIHGNAGCNIINSGIITDNSNPYALSFPAIAATMMACPNMEIERKVLNALNGVKSFELSGDNKGVTLYNESKEALLVLKK